MITDESKIFITAGRGGDGVASFRREKYIPYGGPDGGDGGRGGNVVLEVDRNTDTLSYYNAHKNFKAQNGQRGRNKKMHGRSGNDLVLKVPPGTIVYEINKKTKSVKYIIDLLKDKQNIIICRGGVGGLGNDKFKSSTNRTPREFTQGKSGESKIIYLELRLLADFGLIGHPNSGKSSIVSSISDSKCKIGDYPFTTISPNLGAIKYRNQSIVVADIPGLIKGSSSGKGLGIKFLKHIQRTRGLIYVLDISSDFIDDYQIIRKELKQYSTNLYNKDHLIVLNKIDLFSQKQLQEARQVAQKLIGKNILYISAKHKTNLNQLKDYIIKHYIKYRS
jgi:GTP-binding protein